jgi:adenylate cyclase, class 2
LLRNLITGRLYRRPFYFETIIMRQIVEIKAYCKDPSYIRNYLLQHNAIVKGTDLQIDTYFHATKGRLKLRQGNLENALIYYNRENIAGPKMSKVDLFKVADNSNTLKELLTKAQGVKVIVEKKREIYFIENVKFHIDEVKGLGNFAEIEAIDEDGSLGEEYIRKQCNYYLQQFNISETDLLTHSYSDLLLNEV